ncbi:MAG: hypothetical protein ACI9OJ_004617 [Myxococcota bacterium]|jgi:hypothetical protein
MTDANFGIDVLTETECWELLSTASVGRLAVDIAGRPDVFPINHVVDRGEGHRSNTIVFRTHAGTKLSGAILMRHVAFEVDGYDPTTRNIWSVVVKGEARTVEGMEDLYAAQDLPLYSWVATPKPDFVRITPERVTGRRFHVVSEASVDGSLGWGTESRDSCHAHANLLPDPTQPHHPGRSRLRPD